jgi:hypothetical protein
MLTVDRRAYIGTATDSAFGKAAGQSGAARG